MKRPLSASKARAGPVRPKVLLIHNSDPFFIFKRRIIIVFFFIQYTDFGLILCLDKYTLLQETLLPHSC